MATMPPTYEVPSKKIKDRIQFESWKSSSKTLKAILGYLSEIDLPYQEGTGHDTIDTNTTGIMYPECLQGRIGKVTEMLQTFSKWIDEIPLEKRTDMRFGNITFRKWHAKLVEEIPKIAESILPRDRFGNAFEEYGKYLCHSFGDESRIDYGTGHECTFLCSLYCLEKGYGYFSKEERNDYVSVLFEEYMRLMRKLQATYMLEPAGSHGVWGLDDFQHIVFILGANQMKKQTSISPQDVLNIAQDAAPGTPFKNFFLGAVRNILDTKKGAPFYETSPQLNDILSTVPSWDRCYGGLIKMWVGEVLEKFPVTQHFIFGTTLPFE